MKSEFLDLLNQLILDASKFASNDVLVNILASKNCISFDENEPILYSDFQRIYQKNQQFLKETGTSMLCIAQGTIHWKENGKDLVSPLILIPVKVELNKVTKQYSTTFDPGDAIVNPYVANRLEKEFDLVLESPIEINAITSELRNSGFENIDKNASFIGNFHHHRFVHIKELELLTKCESYSAPFSQLLGSKTELKYFPLSNLEILPADDDHRRVFKEFTTSNCVVQGPPGTGKSQLLINIIGKALLNQSSLVVVSEKRAALEVIQKKLTGLGLEALTYISSSDVGSKTFLQSLKKSWDFFEKTELHRNTPVFIKEDLENNLQFILQLLSQPQLIGGTSYSEFLKLSGNSDFSSLNYTFNKPEIPFFVANESFLKLVYEQNLNPIIGKIKASVFQLSQLDEMSKHLDDMVLFSKKIVQFFDVDSWGEINKVLHESITFTLFQNDFLNQFEELLQPESKLYKKYATLKKKYLNAKKRVDENQNYSEWKIVPSPLEVSVLLSQLEETSFFKKRKFARRWKEISNISLNNAEKSLLSLKENYEWELKKRSLEHQLIEIGIHFPETEIQQIDALKHLLTTQKWELYKELSKEKKEFLNVLGPQLERFRLFMKHYFILNDSLKFQPYLSELKKRMVELIPHLSSIKNLSSDCILLIDESENFLGFKTRLLGSHYTDFKRNYPQLSNFDVSSLSQKIETILEQEQIESNSISQLIIESVKQKFTNYQTLLTQPSARLSEAEKSLKKELRKGKSILVREFSKSRSHLSLRILFESEAKHWIQILKPVWLSNTGQLANCFPFEKDLFDVCILDEASQIPLENSLGTLYRSKRAIIAGDEHQMGPSSYFKSGKENSLSLLHQANYYFKKIALKHHYRSSHRALIQFSNIHFYKGELHVFPSAEINQQPIQFHYLPTSSFIERKNREEAQKAGELIERAIDIKETLGIVAFSQQQVDCILEQLSTDVILKLETRIEQLTAFIKPLEKIQGDECEHLIISTAYAKNDANEFKLKFGPLNRESGRNRLNVLFSRASKKIDFITSINESDLALSTNESVNLLRQWLNYAANQTEAKEVKFPFNLEPLSTGNEITFSNIYSKNLSANELITLHRVLTSRGWKIKYD